MTNEVVGKYFNPGIYVTEVLNKPKKAAGLFAASVLFEIVFPAEWVLHWIFLAMFGTGLVFMGIYAMTGEMRREQEENAFKKVPYIGDALLLRKRTWVESVGFKCWVNALVISMFLVPILVFAALLTVLRVLYLLATYAGLV